MIHRDDKRPADSLDRATEALRDAPVPDGPPPALVASTVEALRSSETLPDDVRLSKRRRRMFRMIRYGGAATAAAVVLTLVGYFWLTGRSAEAAFARVIENVRNAQSVSFVFRQQLGGPPTVSFKWRVQGDAVRMEMPGQIVVIADLKQKKMVELNLAEKVAQVSEIDEKTARDAKRVTNPLANPVDYFGKLTAEDAEKTGETELDGRKVDVYRLKRFWQIELEEGDDQSSITAWVDQKSGLPVRIAVRASFHAEGKTKDWFVLEDFRWNQPLDPDLFKLDIPEGYTVIEAPPRTQKAARATFAKVIEDVKKAASVTCTVRSGLGDEPEMTAELYAQAGTVRRKTLEIGIQIEDLGQGKAVQLLPASKRAYRWQVDKGHPAEMSKRFPNPAALFRTVKSEDVEGAPVPVRSNGQMLWQYRLKRVDFHALLGDREQTIDANDLLVFVDPRTQMPAKISLHCTMPGQEKVNMWFSWEDLQWDKPVDPDLFKLEIPEGYSVIEGEPTPEDLAAEREASSRLYAIDIDFANVIKNVNKATSVTCRVSSSQIDEPRAISANLYVQGDLVRRESLVIQIEDWKQGKAVQFPNTFGAGPLPASDQAYQWDLDKERVTEMERRFPNPALLFRKMKSEDAEKVREMRLKGRKVVYRVNRADLAGISVEFEEPLETNLFVVVDPETELPARISLDCRPPGGKESKRWFIWDDLKWDKSLDPGLFKLEIPHGQKIIDGPPPEGPPWPDLEQLIGTKRPAGN